MTQAPMFLPCGVHMRQCVQAAACPSGQAGHAQPHTCTMCTRSQCCSRHRLPPESLVHVLLHGEAKVTHFGVALRSAAACNADQANTRHGRFTCPCLVLI